MNKGETLSAPSPEIKRPQEVLNLKAFNIFEIEKNNPTTNIINPSLVENITKNFSYTQFKPIDIAYVHNAGWLIIDGNNRLKALTNNPENLKKIYLRDDIRDGLNKVDLSPEEAFNQGIGIFNDVTTAILNNKIFTPEEELEDIFEDGKHGLTYTQFMRASIEPVRRHNEYSDLRIAAEVIKGWESMVGKDIAEIFSSFAAIQFINKEFINVKDLKKISTKLNTTHFFSLKDKKLEKEVNKTIAESLYAVADIMNEMNLTPTKVERSLFSILAYNTDVFSDRAEIVRNILGSLYIPTIDRIIKNSIDFSQNNDIAVFEELRSKIAFELYKHIGTLSNNRYERSKEINEEISNIISDPSLTYMDIHEIVNGKNTYYSFKSNRNRELLSKEYIREYKIDKDTKLNNIEEKLINIESKRFGLSNFDPAPIAKNIKIFINKLEDLSLKITNLKNTSEDENLLLENGWRMSTLKKAFNRLINERDRILEDLNFSGAFGSISDHIKRIDNLYISLEKELNNDIIIDNINSLLKVNNINLEPILQADFINLLKKQFGNLDSNGLADLKTYKSNFDKVDGYISLFSELRPSLQTSLITGRLRNIKDAIDQESKFKANELAVERARNSKSEENVTKVNKSVAIPTLSPEAIQKQDIRETQKLFGGTSIKPQTESPTPRAELFFGKTKEEISLNNFKLNRELDQVLNHIVEYGFVSAHTSPELRNKVEQIVQSLLGISVKSIEQVLTLIDKEKEEAIRRRSMGQE